MSPRAVGLLHYVRRVWIELQQRAGAPHRRREASRLARGAFEIGEA